MRHFIKFTLIGTVVATGMLSSGHAVPEFSPEVRKEIRNFAEKRVELCYEQLHALIEKYSLICGHDYSLNLTDEHRKRRQDVDIFCTLLDELPLVLTNKIKLRLSSCDGSGGLRKAITPFRQKDYKMMCTECLCELFFPYALDNDNTRLTGREGGFNVLNVARMIHSFCTNPSDLHNERIKSAISESIAESNSPYTQRSYDIIHGVSLNDYTQAKSRNMPRTVPYIISERNGRYEYNPFCMFGGVLSDEVINDIGAKCYAEALRQSSPKARIYHRMFLFFDEEIPESDAALFYGEEVFRSFLRYEYIKRTVENKTIDAKTHLPVGRFYRLSDKLFSLRNFMVTVAEAGLKKDFFRSCGFVDRFDNKLPREFREKIKKETDFIDRMVKKLRNMRDDLNALSENPDIALWTIYRDYNWWSFKLKIGEEEGKKILEEIE